MSLKNRIAVITSSLIGVYALSYVAISAKCGYYYPSAYGGNDGGIKFHRWYPLGDLETNEANNPTILSWVYFPLTAIDTKFWHTSDMASSMNYPIKFYYDSKSRSYKSHFIE